MKFIIADQVLISAALGVSIWRSDTIMIYAPEQRSVTPNLSSAAAAEGCTKYMRSSQQQQSPTYIMLVPKKPCEILITESCIFNRASARRQTIFQAANFSWALIASEGRLSPRALHNLVREVVIYVT